MTTRENSNPDDADDDVLARATRAFRGSHDDAAARASETPAGRARAAATELRVLTSIADARRARRRRAAWLLPVAATFVAGVAWATASGHSGRLLAVVAAAFHPSTQERVATSPLPLAPLAAASPDEPALPPATAPANVDAPLPRLAPAPVVPSPAKPAPPHAAARVDAQPAATAPRPALAHDPEALYDEAHKLHFVDHDFAAAVTAWDAYLASSPSPTLAPEARFNRAVALVRLDRKDDARVALRAFADGRYGAYRQSDAKRLLDSLDRP